MEKNGIALIVQIKKNGVLDIFEVSKKYHVTLLLSICLNGIMALPKMCKSATVTN